METGMDMMDMNFDFDFGFDEAGGKQNEEYMESEVEAKKARRRTTECTELSKGYEYRRAFSEVKMLEAMKYVKLTEGMTYNFITAGDVDSLSYLKVVLNQHSLDYLLLTTWCMAAEDILQIQEWYKGGAHQALRHVCGRNLPEDLPDRVANGQEILRGKSERWTCRRVPQPCEDLRRVQRGGRLLFRHSDERKYQYQSENGARQHHNIEGPLSILSGIF
jgi:hypothetical protein